MRGNNLLVIAGVALLVVIGYNHLHTSGGVGRRSMRVGP
jgi:hypothetical protein